MFFIQGLLDFQLIHLRDSSSNQFVTRPCFENVELNAIRPVRRFLSRSAQLTRQCMRFDAKKAVDLYSKSSSILVS